jgi:hypothetical protein
MIIQANQTRMYPFQAIKTEDTSKKPYAFIFIGLFLTLGLILNYAYPVKEDKIILFIATIALTLFLLFGYFFPVPADQVEYYLSAINSFFGG